MHHHPLLAGLSGNRITLTDFHQILLAFEVYYRLAEAARTAPAPDGMPDAPVKRWLSHDLRRHGLGAWPASRELSVPQLDTSAKVAGYLYTKQGSTLGGHVISKHLEKQLGLTPGTDQAFFNGYGADNGPQWKRFVAALEDPAANLSEDEVVNAAQAAFTAIARVCDRVHALRCAHAT